MSTLETASLFPSSDTRNQLIIARVRDLISGIVRRADLMIPRNWNYFPAPAGCTLLTSLLTDLMFQGRTSTMESISMNLSRSVTQKMFSGNSLVPETRLQTFLVRPPFSWTKLHHWVCDCVQLWAACLKTLGYSCALTLSPLRCRSI